LSVRYIYIVGGHEDSKKANHALILQEYLVHHNVKARHTTPN